MRHKVEAHAAKALLVEPAKICFAETVVGIGHAAILAVALRDGIDNHSVVDAVTTGVDQHRALQAQNGLQFLEVRQTGIGRGISAVRRVRILITGSEDVAVRIGGAGWRLILGLVSVRVRSFAGGNGHDHSWSWGRAEIDYRNQPTL